MSAPALPGEMLRRSGRATWLAARDVLSVTRRFLRRPGGWAGMLLLGVLVAVALARPVLMATVWEGKASIYAVETGFDHTVIHPAGPSPAHPLGTDAMGRDVLSMISYAMRTSLELAVVAAVVTGVVGMAVGAASAVWRGPVDGVFSHVSDAFLLIPPPIALMIMGMAGEEVFGPAHFGLAYGLLFGLGPAAVVLRFFAREVMEKPFIEAARVAGGGPLRIVAAHLTPHLVPLAAVQAFAAVTGAVVTQAFVDFLGQSITRVSLGSLVYTSVVWPTQLGTPVAWRPLLLATFGISLLCSAFYLIGSGLRQVVEPRAAGGRRWW